METKHTPGPWKLSEILLGDYTPDSEKPDTRSLTHFIEGPNGEVITYGLPNTEASDELSANAVLIAAAPDLLEACKQAYYHLKPEPDMPIECLKVYHSLYLAIIKAEGV